MSLYEQRSFWEFAENSLHPGGLELTEHWLKRLQLAQKTKIVDVGCALGTGVQHLIEQGHCAVGIESSAVLVEEAKKRFSKAEFLQGRAEELPLPDASAQVLVCECSFSLFEDKEKAAAEIRRVIQPGGSFVMMDIVRLQKKMEPAAGDINTCAAQALTKDEILRLCERQGFYLQEQEDLSEHLHGFVARMTWEYGSAQLFWQSFVGKCFLKQQEKPKMGYSLFIFKRR